jgi:hypothetical protein
MFSGVMGFGCLVDLWALDVWWIYGLWMFGGAMGLGCLVELSALEVLLSRNKWEIIEKERKLFITTDHTLNISE